MQLSMKKLKAELAHHKVALSCCHSIRENINHKIRIDQLERNLASRRTRR